MYFPMSLLRGRSDAFIFGTLLHALYALVKIGMRREELVDLAGLTYALFLLNGLKTLE